MAELGFVRNESARALRVGKTSALAYVMLDAGNPFFTDVAQGIELAAESAELSLFICNSDNRAAREDTHLAHLQQQRVQGILITPVDPEAPALDAIARHGTPVVIVDRIRQDESFCSVAVDDVLGGRLAVAHLVDRGHTRVAFVGGPHSIGQVRDRLEGARAAWAEAGLPDDDLVVDPVRGAHRRRGPLRRRAAGRAAEAEPADRGVLRQRPGRARPAPAVDQRRRAGARGPGDRGVRRHRVRRGGRGAADLGPPAAPAAGPDRGRAGDRRGDQPARTRTSR